MIFADKKFHFTDILQYWYVRLFLQGKKTMHVVLGLMVLWSPQVVHVFYFISLKLKKKLMPIFYGVIFRIHRELFFLITVALNQTWILITLFLLIGHQTEFRLVQNQSEKD